MKVVTEFPFEILEEDHIRIPMSDGVRLSAKIRRPDASNSTPVPAILEFIPYRKRFGTAVRDAVTHRYISGHGYACVRVDLRGSGESEGVLEDEYLPLELDDGVAVISWIAAQPWCGRQRRDDGHLMGGLQCAPDRRSGATRLEGNRERQFH